MSAQLKTERALILTAFLEAIKIRNTEPREFLNHYADENPERVLPIGRELFLEAMESYLRGHMRIKVGPNHCDQLNLWPDLFTGGPVGIATREGGYVGSGRATDAQWQYQEEQHQIQIQGHQDSVEWIRGHRAQRRKLGMPNDVGFYEWLYAQPGSEPDEN